METLEEIIDTEEYRDSIATVDSSGKRIWVYPKKPKGSFHNKRIIATIIFLAIFFITPFVWVDGHPLFMFNFFERKFILFGRVFMPQDFHLLAIGLITSFVFVILFTVVYGRLWCGWTCPQTVFMEMVFRKIEYLIEGDSNQQRKLNAQPWNSEKIRKKALKQGVFILISIIIAHWTMMYLVGWKETLNIISQPPTENLAGFIGIVFFTGIFYGVFAYLREQACIAICPYGRLQGVLLGKDSVAISYDYKRGEPRGKLTRKQKKEANIRPLTMADLAQEDNKQGDCIDCKLCVKVCPTGIDIRNGNQLECVNCTACIDACDEVMDKIKKPRGLIRYASHNNIENGTKFKFTSRILAYSGVLLILLSVLGFLLIQRGQIETTFLRQAGTTYQETNDGKIMNVYQVTIVNKSPDDKVITKFVVINKKGAEVVLPGNKIEIKKAGTAVQKVIVRIPKEEITDLITRLKIEVWAGKEKLETVSTNF